MDEFTIRRLNQLNRAFYAQTAPDFHETRQTAWQGWSNLLAYFPNKHPLRVLDVGCGNGRFGVFLTEHFPKLIYLGLDTDLQLLRYAQTTLSQTSLEYLLVQQDVVETPPSAGLFDVVALFGVIHHIPGEATRRALLQQLAERVAPDGVLVFTTWRFYEQERFRQKIVPWPADFAVEKHDFLLDWQRGAVSQTEALRYCHYVDDEEQEVLVKATELREVARFRADGKSADLNSYSVLKNN